VSNMDEELTPFDIVMAVSERATAEHQARIERAEEKKYAYGKLWRRFKLPPLFSWPAMFIWGRDDYENCYLKRNQ
tara:strand:+ start:5903 stop:6127 length:225 start_codon:yes stop_codon:yes gene_type:complete